MLDSDIPKFSCNECLKGLGFPSEFTMAFQPIVDVENKSIYSHEALVRGVNGEGAGWVLNQVTSEMLYKFDQACRVKAIELASKLKIDTYLNINFLPNAVYKPETCIRTTLEACEEYGFPIQKIIFEVTEHEKVYEYSHLVNIFKEYKKIGFKTAIDDFGEGYSGIGLLVEFQPDMIKIDRKIIDGISKSPVKKSIVNGILNIAKDLGILVEVEGIEEKEDYIFLKDLGVRLFQGFYFAKPVFEGIGKIDEKLF
jgi:EAL domain-containing protein (putative c-di-GMP-specific phosphodiesterase class I)